MLSKLPGRSYLVVVWILAVGLILLLGWLRHFTKAEYAFASAIIVPVFFVTWAGGYWHGIVLSALAAFMWVVTDIMSLRPFSESWIPFVNGMTRLATYCLITYLTARVRTLLKQESELATHDELTGVLNRRAFMEIGTAEANHAKRYGEPAAIMFLDLDDFKQLNDQKGHLMGDNALKAVGLALQATLRSTDHVARMGGDEFAVYLSASHENAAMRAGEKVSMALAQVLKRFPPVTASIGIACFERVGENFDGMLHAADSLMYEVKDRGKNQVLVRSFTVENSPTQENKPAT